MRARVGSPTSARIHAQVKAAAAVKSSASLFTIAVCCDSIGWSVKTTPAAAARRRSPPNAHHAAR